MVEQPELKIQEVPVEVLVPYAHNAKLHSAKQVSEIANSISEFGNCDPIGVWHNAAGEMEIVEGHGRLLALKKLGVTSAPVITLDHLSDAQRRAYTHVHNQTTLSSEFDPSVLFADLGDLDFDFPAFGFDELPEDEVEVLEAEEPKTVETRVKPGEVWALGEHRVMCGDATSQNDVDLVSGGGHFDLLLTDPPYNVSYEGKTSDALVIDNDAWATEEDFTAFLTTVFLNAQRALKPGAAFYIWLADMKVLSFERALLETELGIRQKLVWNKSTFCLGRQDYQWKHEPCFYGWRNGGSHRWFADRKQATVIDYERPPASVDHPTMKPVGLMTYLIGNSTRKGDRVLDVFAGSGSTLLACEQTGRVCCSLEIDAHYCDVIVARWEELTGRQAELLA